MRLLTLSVAIACHVCILVPPAVCQDRNTQPEQLHFTIGMPGTGGGRVVLTASTIQRDLSSRASESIMQLKGNVEVRMITCVPSGASAVVVCEGAMVMHADEVDYNEKTGEIKARGDVNITPHRAPSQRQ
jgi:lipopolysaccharide assembly outer membrane protein LptD (OstA)